MNKINHVILCILDDVKASDFFYFIRRGLLPNFKKLMEQGIWSDTCITDFPATTFPSHVSIITGTYTGHYLKEPCHGVPLFNWMERTEGKPFLRNYGAWNLQIYRVNEDLGKNCRTMFEMINEGNKSSISQFINRGTNYFFPENKFKLILYYLLLRYSIQMRQMAIRVNSII
ncbi:MAG: alkaline phosphatase family protein, partial [Promethearchaeota archaeon]